MSSEAWFGVALGLAGLSWTLLGALVLLVWRASAIATGFRYRIETLERESVEIAKLRDHIWALDRRAEVRAARASAGQFDQGNSEPPGGAE